MFLSSIFKPSNAKRIGFFLLVDVLLSIATIFIAYLLRFNFSIPPLFLPSMLNMMVILIPLKIFIFFIFKIYFVAWRYFGLLEYKKLIFSHLLIYPLFIVIFLVVYDSFWSFPRSVIFIDFFLSLFFIGFLRIARRVYLEFNYESIQVSTLLFGVNVK
jgi:UDP-N-acetyl-D-glucosamine 4,6-dehydratase